MSAFERVKQWGAMSVVWHLFDATWQNPLESAKLIEKYLKGMYKPFYSPLSLCGDHVVVINSREIAFPGQEWRWRVYFHHTGYPGGASWTRAWEVHDKDPTMVFRKAVYHKMKGNIQRRYVMERLHIYPDANVPANIMKNITNQIRPLREIPVTLDKYTEEERETFPKVLDLPADYIVR